jgi:hypothetical protein
VNDQTDATWRQAAEQIFNANRNRDYALYEQLLKRYPLGTSRRERIDAELRLLSAEYRAGNPPCYFR